MGHGVIGNDALLDSTYLNDSLFYWDTEAEANLEVSYLFSIWILYFYVKIFFIFGTCMKVLINLN